MPTSAADYIQWKCLLFLPSNMKNALKPDLKIPEYILCFIKPWVGGVWRGGISTFRHFSSNFNLETDSVRGGGGGGGVVLYKICSVFVENNSSYLGSWSIRCTYAILTVIFSAYCDDYSVRLPTVLTRHRGRSEAASDVFASADRCLLRMRHNILMIFDDFSTNASMLYIHISNIYSLSYLERVTKDGFQVFYLKCLFHNTM